MSILLFYHFQLSDNLPDAVNVKSKVGHLLAPLSRPVENQPDIYKRRIKLQVQFV